MEMTRQEKIMWLFMASILVLLFLLSSTDIIIKEKETSVYSISVIIGDTTDEYYKNFRKGVEMAADEYNVDLNFITLYEKGSAQAQIELLNRELSDGAQAIVFEPVKQGECKRYLEEMALSSPLILLGNSTPGDWAMVGLSQDYQAAGRLLGEAVVKENASKLPVLLFTQGLDYGYNEEVYTGLLNVLSKAGFQVHHYESVASGLPNTPIVERDASFEEILEEKIAQHQEVIVVALDVKSLETSADLLSDHANYQDFVRLYGFGSTTKVLNQMDRGLIQGLITRNQFDEGYLSIVKAVEAIEKQSDREQIVLASYYIEKADLKEKYFEKILYPIE